MRRRDFTYIDDIVIDHIPGRMMAGMGSIRTRVGVMPYKILPMQPGDVQATYADLDDLQQAVGFEPATSIEEGLRKFVEWYVQYYQVGRKPLASETSI